MSPRTLKDNKQDVAESILNAAMQLFTSKGVEKTSMRNIASSIGYSVGNVYVYFKNKAEILHALHSKGFIKLRSRFEVLKMVTDPLERLKAMGKVYLSFAAENQQLYHLMFTSMAPIKHLDQNNADHWKEGNGTYAALTTTVQECQDNGLFSDHDLESMSFLIWSAVHGMATLNNSSRISRLKFSSPETMVNKGYDEFCKMLDAIS